MKKRKKTSQSNISQESWEKKAVNKTVDRKHQIRKIRLKIYIQTH